MSATGATSGSRWAWAAAGWCVVFAAVHLFWGLGGSAGLASSAGADLAERRPVTFVVLGLFGVAVVLLLGVVLVVLVTTSGAPGGLRRVARVLLVLVGAGLVVRALLVEVVLATAPGVRDAVGPLETRWSLVLWDPWFLLGGVLLVLAGVKAGAQVGVAA